jgi:ectoine hydroxylase-related dioxygenase (phytanoyl-CoA dioxygenase family)
VPGSHTQVWQHRQHDAPQGFGKRVSEREVTEHWGAAAVRSLPMGPGDVLLFHDLLLHGSHANRDGRSRWALIPTYRDASVVDHHILPELWQAPVPL